MREVWSLFIQLYKTCIITGDVVCLNNALNDYDTSLPRFYMGTGAVTLHRNMLNLMRNSFAEVDLFIDLPIPKTQRLTST